MRSVFRSRMTLKPPIDYLEHTKCVPVLSMDQELTLINLAVGKYPIKIDMVDIAESIYHDLEIYGKERLDAKGTESQLDVLAEILNELGFIC